MNEQTPRTTVFFSQAKWLIMVPLALTSSQGLVLGAPTKPPIAKVKPSGAVGTEYILGPEDVLEITVSNHPDLNMSVTVRPDGKISLPRAGDLMARGKSARVLGREIQNRLSATLNNARVQVLLKQERPRQARIIGAVTTAGTYTLKPNSRIVDLVALAGGLSTKATRISGRVIRSGNVIQLDVSKAVTHPDSPANVALHPDDLVVLDAQDYSKQITVVGSVKQPGAYDLEEGLTVMGLLARAGGATPDAALRKAQVLRDGKPVLENLLDALAPNSPVTRFTFQPGDILSIPQNQDRFGVFGEVVKPSYYPVPEKQGESTVLKALAEAGGPSEDGDLSQVTLTRTVNGQTQKIPINAALILAGEAPNSLVLLPDDVLQVPKKKEKRVSVIGQVAKPDSYVLEDGMTLLDVLAKAGNPISGAGLNRAYVQRNGNQILLNLRPAIVDHVVSNEIANFQLQENDALVIPDNKEQVQVVGSVTHPGPYSLDDDMSLVSLLAKAGSPVEGAALSQAYVQRSGQKIPFDLRSSVTGNIDPAVVNFRFVPGDVLVIPANQTRFAVWGQVVKPATYPYPENPSEATVLNALTTAGGPVGGTTTNLAQAGIVRNVNGQPQFIPVDLTQLFSNKKGAVPTNVQMQPNDILYIPSKKEKGSVLSLLGPIAALGTLF